MRKRDKKIIYIYRIKRDYIIRRKLESQSKTNVGINNTISYLEARSQDHFFHLPWTEAILNDSFFL